MKMPGGVSQGEVTRCQPRAEGCHLISVARQWILTHRHQANEPWAVIEGVDIVCLKKLLQGEIWYLLTVTRVGKTWRAALPVDSLGDVASSQRCVSSDYVEYRSGVEWVYLQTRWMTYQSAHMTTSKRPSIVDTSRSLSHLTTLRKNNLDYEFGENDKQRKRKGKKRNER